VITPERFRDIVAGIDFCNKKIAVAVSGGSDSMALLLLLDEYLRKEQKADQLTALTVDHRLPEAPDDVEYVEACMAERGIKHETFVWHHENICSQMEERGRKARYELLTKYCTANNISILFVAHQALDQIETFVMRFMRGSSITGLCGMKPVSIYNGVTIIRPLLDIDPHELKDTLNRFNQSYVTDIGNLSEKFERVRIRKTLLQMRDFNISGAIHSIKNFHKIDQQIELAATFFIKQHVVSRCFHKTAFLELLPMIAQRVLKLLLIDVSQNFDPLSYKLLENLYNKIALPNFVGTTVHGCYVRYSSGNYISFKKEKRPYNKQSTS
jgi:tRNA(Ile)-lysidine synthase